MRQAFVAGFDHKHQIFCEIAWTDRHHPAIARPQLVEKAGRDGRGARGNDDGIERRARCNTAKTVARYDLDIMAPETPQSP